LGNQSRFFGGQGKELLEETLDLELNVVSAENTGENTRKYQYIEASHSSTRKWPKDHAFARLFYTCTRPV